MVKQIIHSISGAHFNTPFVKIGYDVRSRCGRAARTTAAPSVRPDIFRMRDAVTKKKLFGSTRPQSITCKKCIYLITTGYFNGKPPGTKRQVPYPTLSAAQSAASASP